MSLREFLNRSSSLHGVKRLVTPLWTAINGRSGQDRWLATIKESASRPVAVILDVGSSDGFFLRKSVVHFPQASYHHFEPRPDAAARLKALTGKLATQSTIHATALADESGKTKFAVMGYGDASSLLLSTRGVPAQITEEIEVPVERLDTIVDRSGIGRIGILKIDVEGAERRVLLGARRTLAEKADTVILEISAPRHVDGPVETLDVFRLMFDAGFRLIDTFYCDYLFTKDTGVLTRYNAQ